MILQNSLDKNGSPPYISIVFSAKDLVDTKSLIVFFNTSSEIFFTGCLTKLSRIFPKVSTSSFHFVEYFGEHITHFKLHTFVKFICKCVGIARGLVK